MLRIVLERVICEYFLNFINWIIYFSNMSIVIYNEIDLYYSKICICMNNIFFIIIYYIFDLDFRI